MQNSLTFICRVAYLLIAILCFGCFSSTPNSISESTIDPQESLGDLDNTESLIDSLLENKLKDLHNKVDSIELYSIKNTSQIKTIRDSLKAFHQLNISGDTSDKDIINSLIRIQSKLNIIEEKIFYSDSIYFNLLNDLVLIESQIENLDKNYKENNRYIALSQYPYVKFDLSFSVPLDFKANDIKRFIEDELVDNENEIDIFDDFVSEKSRNLGIDKSIGKYIAFLDTDDWWDPSKLLNVYIAISKG